MQNLGYYNGKIGTLDEMTVPMLDRGCYFGDGVYDAAYSRNHIVYALDEHVDRFFESAEKIGIQPPMEKAELSALIGDLVRRVDDGEQFVYFQVTRGTALRDHKPPEHAQANLWVMLKPCKIRDVGKRNRLISEEDTRYFHCNIKSLNLLPNVLAAGKVAAAGADECVFHRGDVVTECSHSNISVLKNGTLITHPADEMILAGVGRRHLIDACRHFGIPVEERPFTMAELTEADEIILTAAGSLCLTAYELDGKAIGGRDDATVQTLRAYLLKDYLDKTEA